MEIKSLEELETWQNNVIAKILSEKKGIFTICLGRRLGKTRMLLLLANALKPVQVVTTCERTLEPFVDFIGKPTSVLLIDDVEHCSGEIDYSKYDLVVQTSSKPQPNSVNFETLIKFAF